METQTVTSSAPPAPSRHTPGGSSEPKIQHSFDGDVKIFNSTFECRTEIRKTLGNLQQLLQRLEGQNVQVIADIKLRIAGPDAREHTYAVTIHDSRLDVAAFAKQFLFPKKDPASSSDHPNGTNTSLGRRTSRDNGDDDLIEIRPAKKARTEADDGPGSISRDRDTDGMLKEILFSQRQSGPPVPLDFMQQWHAEWVKQGGWLFDSLNKAERLANDHQTVLQSRMASVQDVLGQSMNAASASTMAELASIAKLVHWVEACRKSAADKAQAREEKWRTSSATFHDQSRRDRETAEERLLEEVQKQRVLLERVARASGVEVGDGEKESETTREAEQGEREASLGAQLTAELNAEANRASEMGVAEVKAEKLRETISIDDDDEDGGEMSVTALD
ncbi:hypothetical protein LTS01_022813 [Friedmanniomyces endolithicus]|nr:hypothetical protein LTS01_022813 [Friedmanniomyces endolithicus]